MPNSKERHDRSGLHANPARVHPRRQDRCARARGRDEVLMTDPVAVTVSNNVPVQAGFITAYTGPQGPVGPVGSNGPVGPSGILATIRGVWASGTTYSAGPPPDAVIGSNGHWYISLSTETSAMI